MAALIVVSCSKAATEKEEVVEILQISDDCATDAYDGCCQSQCTGFCTEKSLNYAKHTTNGQHCPCWCD